MQRKPRFPTASTALQSHSIVLFYEGSGRDGAGRSLSDVLAFDLDELEQVHDYIQWLFPLFERSAANPNAPVLDQDSVTTLRRHQDLRRNIRKAFELMLRLAAGPPT